MASSYSDVHRSTYNSILLFYYGTTTVTSPFATSLCCRNVTNLTHLTAEQEQAMPKRKLN